MSGSAVLATSYKKEILKGVHLDTDTYKFLLVKPSPSGTYDATLENVGTPGSGTPSTTNVGTDEVTGTGYTPNGNTLSGFSVSSSGTTAWLDFADTSWASSSISARYGVIYNSSQSGKVVCIIDFGGTQTDSAGTWTYTFPTADASNAQIRLA